MSYVGVDTNISQPVVSSAPSGSGGFDSSIDSYVGGLNVPAYPDFGRLNQKTSVVDAVSSVSNNFLLYAFSAVAGFGVVWLMKK